MTTRDLLDDVFPAIATGMQNLAIRKQENVVATTIQMESIVNVVQKDFMAMLWVVPQVIVKDVHVQVMSLNPTASLKHYWSTKKSQRCNFRVCLIG